MYPRLVRIVLSPVSDVTHPLPKPLPHPLPYSRPPIYSLLGSHSLSPMSRGRGSRAGWAGDYSLCGCSVGCVRVYVYSQSVGRRAFPSRQGNICDLLDEKGSGEKTGTRSNAFGNRLNAFESRLNTFEFFPCPLFIRKVTFEGLLSRDLSSP